jgi:hypothetical protein
MIFNACILGKYFFTEVTYPFTLNMLDKNGSTETRDLSDSNKSIISRHIS